ncbi:hypothetical protein CRG98_008549, partial [Punica granatum]
MALLRGPNRASSSSIPPLTREPNVDPAPWVPPTHALEGDIAAAPAPAIIPVPAPHPKHAPAIHPVDSGHPQSTIPATVSLPSMTIPVPDPTMFAPPPVSVPAPATVYTAPPPMGFPTSSAPVPAHTTEPFPHQVPQPHISLPYQAPPPINITFSKPGTPTQAAPRAPPINFFPETETEQERRMKKMEETIRALQASDPRHSTSYLDSTLFPGMQLPAKVKVPDFQKYDGTKDPRHHLRHYNGKMLQYWDYEQFVIATFQESLSGPALNWFISLRAEDIPSWTELAKKFVEQYQYNMETPPSFLELSTMEMAEGQKFKDYATNWRSEAAKHFPPICEAQQIQMFHGTLKGAYYSHLMGHKSTFSEMIMAGKQVDLGIKLGRLEGPTKKGEGESSRKTASAATPTSGRRSKEASVNAVNVGHNAPQQYSDESQQEGPTPFIIEYVPAEATVGFTGSSAAPVPFIIEVPAREPYQDSKVPWTYEGSVGNLEQQFSVMSVTRSGRVYMNLEIAGK